jgi:glycosyltransferase involved in cell wall biosynthesis
MSRRVCLMTTFYPPYNFGGDGIAVQRLARGLARHGCEVTVVHDADAFTVLSPREADPIVDDSPGVRVITFRTHLPTVSTLLTHQFGRPVMNRRRLRRTIADGRFDTIFFHNASLVGGPGLLPFAQGVPSIYVAHEHWLVCPTHVLWRHNREACDRRQCLRCQLRYHRPPQLWRNTAWFNRQLESVNRFVALSEFSRAKHRAMGFPREMDVVPLFLPDETGPPEPLYDVPPHSRPYCVVIGRLESIKGVEDAIDAFAGDGPADLLVIGRGSRADELQARAARHHRVHFLGFRPLSQLGRYYRHAVASIAPSRGFETFGFTVIEAFSHGTPVLARRLGSFPELIDQSGGGRLFDTVGQLRQLVDELASSPDQRRTLGERGRSALAARWSEGAVIPRYLALIDQVQAAK